MSSLIKFGRPSLPDTQRNIVLIGMPGCGKSTVGVVLAKLLGRAFVDTDLCIQQQQGRTLQQIVDTDGYLELRAIEERTICGLDCRDAVVATGGSAPYSEPAMRHLKTHGTVVFLDVDLQTITRRIGDYASRGLAKRPEQSLADLFEERAVLYRRYADITLDASTPSQDLVAAQIAAHVLHL